MLRASRHRSTVAACAPRIRPGPTACCWRSLDAQVEANLGPFRTAVDLIMSIPGVKNLSAHVIISEIGIDMSRFPSDAHLISWAGVCPGNDESAGKRRSNRLRKGAPWLKTTLVQCAWAAVKKKNSYLQAQFYRIKVRRGPKKAIMAVAASILTAIYHMLEDGTMYQDLGCNHFDRRSTNQQKTTPSQTVDRPWLRGGDQATRRLSRLCGTAWEFVAAPVLVSFVLGGASVDTNNSGRFSARSTAAWHAPHSRPEFLRICCGA